MRLKVSFILLCVLLAGLIPAQAQEEAAFTCPNTGGTLVTAITSDPVSLNGLYANDGASVAVLSYVFNPLTMGGENWGSEIKGDLAESWETSEDGLTWTFKLHEGVLWHDGEELTAADVVYTFNTIQTSEEDIAPFRPRFYQGDQPIQFEAVDDYTVVARLTEPNASFFTDISVPIVPQHILEGQDLREGPFNREPIGTGPFRVVEWNAGESITLEANENYFRGRPCLDRLVIRILPDQQAQVAALQTGEVDFIPNIPGTSVELFEDNSDFTMIRAETDSLFHMMINLSNEKYQDVRVRQALMMAIDRQAVVDIVRQGYGVVHNSHFDHVVPFYEQNKLGGYDYDPERAGALLDEVGITDTDGDGYRDLNGEPWEVNIVSFSGGFRDYEDYAIVVQAFWDDIGIRTNLELRDLSTLVEQLYQERVEDKPYEVHTSGWSVIGPEPNSYAGFYTWTDELGPNISNYRNEEVNSLFAEARRTTDFEARMALYEQIEAILWEELPTLPLYRNIDPAVINNRFNIEAAEFDNTLGMYFRHPERLYEN